MWHPNRTLSARGGLNILQKMERDTHNDSRRENIYWPFANRAEWNLARWLLEGKLSKKSISDFLKLEYVS